ncbi:MAG: hypothetical protein K2X27_23435 [Candidatus Obscuribacterales bacterium]|nr:hypothetical protein [Candidatus Obscuribacterales bacterium]
MSDIIIASSKAADSNAEVNINSSGSSSAHFLNEIFKPNKESVKEFVALNTPPDKVQSASEMLEEAVARFDKADDKQAAMKELKPQFEAAVKRADEELAVADKNLSPILRKLAPDMAKALLKVNPAVNNFMNISDAEKLPQNLRPLMVKYVNTDPADPGKAAIAAKLAAFPKTLKAAEIFGNELRTHGPLMSQYNKPAKELETAIHNSYFAREKFAERLAQSGDKKQGDELRKDAQNIFSRFKDPALQALEWLEAGERMQQDLNKFPIGK